MSQGLEPMSVKGKKRKSRPSGAMTALPPMSGPSSADLACPKSANNGSRAHSITSSQTGEHWLRWSFGQPGLPQSFFVSREVFGTPIRAQHVFEIGNT